ncbi:D-alanine--D-alanine ligase family protein [Rubricoccus marinus]|uniref:D-alanine--D-alanine ligase n=1 Tax=Rubricoccus marinus TaxID=716817 RepID=A0A259TX04_9BACT|nr:D-alanine--D-alanine ligase family protein [Rubricoccus marinus]OZC02299.1 D-alanine--D-alanine ligase A [Rubricoccus marinus]
MPQPLHVGLVYGGQSTEHDVSVRSARNVLAMLGDRHRVTPILITRDGRWLVQTPEALGDPASGDGHPAMFAPESETCSVLEGGDAIRELDLDVAFPILHGQNGEDGRVQGFLHTLGLPFVGPDVLSSAACWDKEVTKRLLEHAGIPVTPYMTVRRGDEVSWGHLTEQLGSPVFVKPCSSGSSVGVTKVSASGELDAALALGFEYDRKLLVETGISGREIECAVLGNETPEASVPGEIVSTAQFYTYDAKYEDPDASRMEVPADLPPEIAETIRALALEAYRALECEGMARVDFFYTASGEVMVNEINTIPGFTSRSMYPVMWAHSGVDNAALVDRLVALAIERHARDAAVRTTR